jgi:pSer/pThr/pTyr-binding forkhead associated (FHA) protein
MPSEKSGIQALEEFVSMAFLYRIKADGLPGEHWVLGETPLVVGREEPADALVEDDTLSRSHFLVVREGLEFFLVDLNSSNGTWVNGQPVTAHRLKSGEIVVAGDSAFCFRVTVPSPTTAPIPLQLLRKSEETVVQPGAA